MAKLYGHGSIEQVDKNKFRITLSAVLELSKNTTETLVPVLANTLDGMLMTPYTMCSSTICFRIVPSTPLLAVRKPVGNTIAPLPFSFSEFSTCWMKQV